MAIEWIDAFRGRSGQRVGDDYTTSSYALSVVQMSTRRSGCFGLALGAETIDRALAGNKPRLIGGVAYQCTVGSEHVCVGLRDGGTTHLSIVIGTDGSVNAYLGDAGGSLIDTADAALNMRSGVPRYIEWQAYIDNSSGLFRVWVDDELAIDYAGDTRNGGALGLLDNVRLAGTTGSIVADYYLIDPDDSVRPIERVGASAMCYLARAVAGRSADWRANDEFTEYDAVRDESGIDGDTSYVYSKARRAVFAVGLDAVPATMFEVLGVRAVATVRRTSTPTGTRKRSLEFTHRQQQPEGGIAGIGAATASRVALSTSYASVEAIYPSRLSHPAMRPADIGISRISVTQDNDGTATTNEARITTIAAHVLGRTGTPEGGERLAEATHAVFSVVSSGTLIPAAVTQMIVSVVSSGSLTVIEDPAAADGLSPGEVPTFVAEIEYSDTEGAVGVALFGDGETWATQSTDFPADTVIEPRLSQPAGYERVIFNSTATFGAVEGSYGECRLTNADGALDAWSRYVVSGRPFRLWAGRVGTSFPAAWSLVLTATMQSIEADIGHVTIRLRDRIERFKRARLRDPASPDPVVFGNVFCVRPMLVDEAALEYAVGQPPANRFVVVQSLCDNGMPLGVGVTVDDDEALAATTAAPGTYNYNPATGRLRVGTRPFGVLTATLFVASQLDEWEDYIDAAAGSLLSTMAQAAGIGDYDIDAVDVAALDVASEGAPLGIWDDQAVDVRTAMDAIANSIGAYFFFDRLDRLRMRQFAAPDPDAANWRFTAHNIVTGSIKRIIPQDTTLGVPCWRVVARSAHNYGPSDALAGAVPASDKAALQQEWPVQTAAEQPDVRSIAPAAAELVVDVFSGGYGPQPGGVLAAPAGDGGEAARRLSLYAGLTELVQLDAVASSALLTTVDIGETVILRFPRYGWTAGVAFLVVGMQTDLARRTVQMTLWRLTPITGGPPPPE